MNYCELSIENLKKESKLLAKKIEQTYKPDLVIFIARGGLIIGKEIAEYFSCDLVAVTATREGDKLKGKLEFLIKYIPKNIRLFLRRKELKSGIHKSNKERKIETLFNANFYRKKKNILLVDDSIDTGESIYQTLNKLKSIFKDSNIEVASINVFSKSEEMVECKYYIYKNMILNTPASIDSNEYKQFKILWEQYKEDI